MRTSAEQYQVGLARSGQVDRGGRGINMEAVGGAATRGRQSIPSIKRGGKNFRVRKVPERGLFIFPTFVAAPPLHSPRRRMRSGVLVWGRL
jgi:hypothetical protein